MKKQFHKLLLLGLLACACTGPGKQQEKVAENTVPAEQTVQKVNNGTLFHDLTLGEAIEKAKLESKYVFIDCHTKSCGPCRQMKKIVFPNKDCGEYMNHNFICISKDMEGESEDTKYLNEKHKLAIFPTYLIIDKDSTLLCEINGAILDAGRFIETIKSQLSEALSKKQ